MIVRRIELSLVLVLNVAFTMAYVVPKARVEVLHPKGFSVSIPDTPGIQTFSFHGNLNSPMEGLENGQFSADILQHKNGRWTFTNRKHEIKPGDALYYWLYVQKDSLGYRRDEQKHDFTGKNSIAISTIMTMFSRSLLHSSVRLRCNFHKTWIHPKINEILFI